MAAFQPVTHVIFDFDGTLVDSVGTYSEVLGRVLKNLKGIEYDASKMEGCRSATLDVILATFVKQFQLDVPIRQLKLECFKEFMKIELSDDVLMPGAEQLIRHLHAHGIPMAIGSSGGTVTYHCFTHANEELFSLMHHVVLATDEPETIRSKPAPDTFLVCASRFDDSPPPEKVLVFEDGISGVQAAVAAGMQVVMVPSGTIVQDGTFKPTVILNSLLDFRPEDFGLPPMEKRYSQSKI